MNWTKNRDWYCMWWLMFVGRLRFGRLFFGINMLTYIGYLVCLTSFIIITYPRKLDDDTGCPVKLTTDDPDAVNSTRKVHYYAALCCFTEALHRPRYIFYTVYITQCFISLCHRQVKRLWTVTKFANCANYCSSITGHVTAYLTLTGFLQYTFDPNFAKWWSILKILSLTDFAAN